MKRVLLAGKASFFVQTLIERLAREGLEVFLLTGSGVHRGKPPKVFEQYEFSFTSPGVQEVLYSVKPEYVIFAGAYDEGIAWKSPRRDMTRYLSGLLTLLTACMKSDVEKFVYLSSQEVFGKDHFAQVSEEVIPAPVSERALAILQGERTVLNFGENLAMRLLVLRLDHLYGQPESIEDIHERIAEMCWEGVTKQWVEIKNRAAFSCLTLGDGAEAVYRLLEAESPRESLYHFSSGEKIDEFHVAEMIRTVSGGEVQVVEKAGEEEGCRVLSNQRFCREFGVELHHHCEEEIPRIYEKIKKNKKKFLRRQKQSRRDGKTLRLVLPLLENVAFFSLAVFLTASVGGSGLWESLDFYLLYVLLFAGVYGKKHGISAAFLSAAAYVWQHVSSASLHNVLIDYNTYLWIVQTFVVGMVVGYIRDRVLTLGREKEEQERYLESQIQDVVRVNESNVRLKDVMEERLITYDGSLGQLYNITRELDHVAVNEVIFYAADIVSQVMGTRDVAIYRMDKSGYARLMTAMSPIAKSLGKSIKPEEEKYRAMVESFQSDRVYINKTLEPALPVMANALKSDGSIRFIIMVWGLSFESLTLHQADMLSVLSYMIYHAADRSSVYWKALETSNSVEGTGVLRESTFAELLEGHRNAHQKGLTEYTVLRVEPRGEDLIQLGSKLLKTLRETDYAGILENGDLGVLLTNSTGEDAGFVIARLEKSGIAARIEEVSS